MSSAEPHSNKNPFQTSPLQKNHKVNSKSPTKWTGRCLGMIPCVNQVLWQGHWATAGVSHGGKLPPLECWVISSGNEELGHSFTTLQCQCLAEHWWWGRNVHFREWLHSDQSLLVLHTKKKCTFSAAGTSAAPDLNFPCHLHSYV